MRRTECRLARHANGSSSGSGPLLPIWRKKWLARSACVAGTKATYSTYTTYLKYKGIIIPKQKKTPPPNTTPRRCNLPPEKCWGLRPWKSGKTGLNGFYCCGTGTSCIVSNDHKRPKWHAPSLRLKHTSAAGWAATSRCRSVSIRERCGRSRRCAIRLSACRRMARGCGACALT